MTRREAILQAVLTRLQAVPSLIGLVERSPLIPAARTDAQQIGVRLLDESPRARTNNQQERGVTVAIAVVTRGAAPDQAAETLLEAVHAALMTDQNLGGLCLRLDEGGTRWELEDADLAASIATAQYVAVYRTHFAALT